LYNLSDIISFQKEEFTRVLAERKKQGKKNIILIGTFASPDEDVKTTLLGPLHGTTILLNVYLAMQNQGHYLGMLYMCCLFACFIIISWIVFYPTGHCEYIVPV
jgi:hypothetical protein